MNSKDNIYKKNMSLRRTLIVAFLHYNNIVTSWIAFPYLPYLVQHFFPAIGLDDIGYTLWIYGSAFACGSIFGNIASLFLIEKFSRRLTLIAYLCGSVTSVIFFTFSLNFSCSVLAVFLLGIFTCINNILRYYTYGTTSEVLMSNGIISGFARISGILIGGILCHPTKYFPRLNSYFIEIFPFLFPGFLSILLHFFAITSAYYEFTDKIFSKKKVGRRSLGTSKEYLHLPNTEDDEIDISMNNKIDVSNHNNISPENNHRQNNNHNNDMSLMDRFPNGPTSGLLSSSPSNSDIRNNNIDSSHGHGHEYGLGLLGTTHHIDNNNNNIDTSSNYPLAIIKSSLSDSALPQTTIRTSLSNNPMKRFSTSPSSKSLSSTISRRVSFSSIVQVKVMETQELKYNKLKYVHPEDIPVGCSTSSATNSNSTGTILSPVSEKRIVRYSNGSEFFHNRNMADESVLESIRRILLKENILRCICLFAFMRSLSVVAGDALVIWLVSDTESGGFAFTYRELSILFASTIGVSQLSVMCQASNYLKKNGVVNMYGYSATLFGIASCFVPAVRLFNLGLTNTLCTIILGLPVALMCIGIDWGAIAANSLLCNSCYSHQTLLVFVLAEILAALLQSMVSCLVGNIVAWTITARLPWPLNFACIWYLLALFCLENYKAARRIPKNMNRRRREPKKPRYAMSMIRGRREMIRNTSSDDSEDDNNDSVDNDNIFEDDDEEVIELMGR